ncbi:MAG: hypothetical protein FGF48_11150, partial [Candidatus Brockarchaeota archaeon]|nr:hypothetical protein [Candidatus Brockarchaeota archaeon]
MGDILGKNCILDVCGKRISEYMVSCLGKFNRGANTVTLRAVGENINRAVEVADILSEEFGIRIVSIAMVPAELRNIKTSCLEIHLELPQSRTEDDYKISFDGFGFIEFPVYHLLLDSLISKGKELKICLKKDGQENPLLTISSLDDFSICCGLSPNILESFGDDLISALYRCGLLYSRRWQEIAEAISEHDDIIMALDTDILMEAVVTEHLINSLSLTDRIEYVHTPNWLLFVIPAAVMHEVETFANSRKEGRLTRRGRLGYRALQEILDLEASKDIQGISVVITGEANPILDTRIELQGLRADFQSSKKGSELEEDRLRLPRMSSGDTIIRDQFKQFLRQIGFHKGAYFLTADKSNASLARAEGLHPIYYKRPTLTKYMGTILSKIVVEPLKISLGEIGDMSVDVPVGKLIYELAVQFGSIIIRWEDKEVEFGCDEKGESLDSWIFRSLRIKREDLEELLNVYKGRGRFFLPKVIKVWNEICKKLYGTPESENTPESIEGLHWMKGEVLSVGQQKSIGFVQGNDNKKY